MKEATVREIQHNFSQVLKMVEAGEEFHILHRKRFVAKLLPAETSAPEKEIDWNSHHDEIVGIFGNRQISGKSASDLVSEGRGER